MAPKRTTRANPIATTTSVTNAQLKAMIDQGVNDALVACDADRNTNGDDSHSTEGVVELIQWFEKMETVFSISNCSVENQIKFSTCTLLAGALTWWNSHVRTVGHDVAYAMTWTDLKKKMTDKYCPRGEIKKLEAELWNLKVIRAKDMQEAIEIATELLDKKIYTFLLMVQKRRKESKMITNNNNNNKTRGRTLAVPTLQDRVKRNITEDLNLCAQNASITITDNVLQKATSQKPACYECRSQGHFKRDCPKQKNNNRGNQGGNGNAPVKVYVVGRAGTNPDSNVVTGTFLLNNRYASVLFDTGANRSFVSTTFSSQIDITPSTLDHYYDVELADGRIISLDIIIDMDWLAKYQAIIVCTDKIIRIPWGNEMLIIRGNESDWGNETHLNIISCTETQKYMLKGCPIFLAHVTTKETKDKSEKKRLEDVPIVRNFLEVFS
ncbi:putative reverse transcriptase domain-containing protein [Tanacetum coccineum]